MMFEKVTIKYDGEVKEFQLNELDLATPQNPNDSELLYALSLALNVPNLNGFDVYRAETIINVAPHAQYANIF
jgi:hypothetical protein